MAKKTSTKTANIKKAIDHKGIKGGVSAISPEIVGAMTGAAIGGVAGLMLANKKTRENLLVVKDKALESAGDMLGNVNVSIDEGKLEGKTSQAAKLAEKNINNTLHKKIK